MKVNKAPVYDQEGMLVVHLDLRDIARSKFDFDVVGDYAPSDVFELTVYESPMLPVITKSGLDTGEVS